MCVFLFELFSHQVSIKENGCKPTRRQIPSPQKTDPFIEKKPLINTGLQAGDRSLLVGQPFQRLIPSCFKIGAALLATPKHAEARRRRVGGVVNERRSPDRRWGDLEIALP
jgi:hypothetical protein